MTMTDDQAPVPAGTDALSRALTGLGPIHLRIHDGVALIDADSAASVIVDLLHEGGWHVVPDPTECTHESLSGTGHVVLRGRRASDAVALWRCDACSALLLADQDGHATETML